MIKQGSGGLSAISGGNMMRLIKQTQLERVTLNCKPSSLIPEP
jgi:hypothetical protein